MKNILVILISLLITINVSAQNKKIISINFAYGQNDLNHITTLIGSASYHGDGTIGFGLGYQQYFNKNFSILSGVEYSYNKVVRNPSFYHPTEVNSNIQIVSIPLKVEYQFLKYLIIGGGAIFDLEINRNIDTRTDKQFGIGASIHTGLKVSFDNFSVGIIPYFNIHTLIPFENEKYHQRLFEEGVKLFVGYQI